MTDTDVDPDEGAVSAPRDEDHGRAELRPVGELEDAPAFREAIREAGDDFRRSLRIDLSEVTYLPSTVIGVLFGALKLAHEAGSELVVAARAGTVVQRVLVVTALPHEVLGATA
ncbi:MAG: anti-sigma factor antagonist [Nocardioides sp.]|nr:anti-sigma factor antagonist [Nocardioides sp.]